LDCGGVEKNGKLYIQNDFCCNVAIKKNPYLLPFIDAVLDKVVGHNIYIYFSMAF
jgi:hypothetical protein